MLGDEGSTNVVSLNTASTLATKLASLKLNGSHTNKIFIVLLPIITLIFNVVYFALTY